MDINSIFKWMLRKGPTEKVAEAKIEGGKSNSLVFPTKNRMKAEPQRGCVPGLFKDCRVDQYGKSEERVRRMRLKRG